MKKSCKGNPFCKNLDEVTRENLCKHVTVSYQMPKQIQSYQADEMIRQFEIVSEGVLLKYTLLEDGTQQSIEIVKEGGLLGEHLLFENHDYPDYFTMALSKVRKCNYPIKVIQNLFDENKNFARVLTQSLTKHLSRNHVFWIDLHSLRGEEKVQYVYSYLEKLGCDMKVITQEDIALIAGVSRITVARAMKRISV
jgi:CRP-like cAMP-binding protein